MRPADRAVAAMLLSLQSLLFSVPHRSARLPQRTWESSVWEGEVIGSDNRSPTPSLPSPWSGGCGAASLGLALSRGGRRAGWLVFTELRHLSRWACCLSCAAEFKLHWATLSVETHPSEERQLGLSPPLQRFYHATVNGSLQHRLIVLI